MMPGVTHNEQVVSVGAYGCAEMQPGNQPWLAAVGLDHPASAAERLLSRSQRHFAEP